MVPKISNALKSVQTSIELINKHAEANAFRAVQSELITLNKSVLDAQILAIELHDELQVLKKKQMEREDWEQKTMPNYKLAELAPGVFVYKPDPSKGSAEPDHCLCANCFLDQKKSILQRSRWEQSGTYYNCPKCGNEILDHSTEEKSSGVVTAGRRSSFDFRNF